MYVGNDIVAYKHSRCLNKWQDKHFLQKILQPIEINNLAVQTNKDAYLWALWNLKEAAYKLSCFLGNRNKFHPIQFSVTNIVDFEDTMVQHIDFSNSKIAFAPHCNIISEINFEDKAYFGKTILTHQFIHSLVSGFPVNENVHSSIGEHSNFNKNDYSNEVRSFAKQQLALKNIVFDNIEKDKDGIPFIMQNGKPQYISLSHDQQFVSYAFVS